jgi:hypothetical protein
MDRLEIFRCQSGPKYVTLIVFTLYISLPGKFSTYPQVQILPIGMSTLHEAFFDPQPPELSEFLQDVFFVTLISPRELIYNISPCFHSTLLKCMEVICTEAMLIHLYIFSP